MDSQNAQNESTLGLSREEQWVLHHVMLDSIEMESRAPENADPPPLAVYQVFEKLDTGTRRFTGHERRCIRDELRRYADAENTPDRDKPIAKSILDRLERRKSAIL